MDESLDYIENNFFIIDSNNLDNISSKLYGYSIYNGNIVFQDNIDKTTILNGEGTYVRVLRNGNQIEISQDYNGSFGLFVYSLNNNFVISNSFLKLVEYVKDKYPISLNKDVALSLIPSELTSIAYKQTMINEIEILPNNFIIHINTLEKTFFYEKQEFETYSIDLDSEEGIKILDTWFYKWIGTIRNLFSKTNAIQVDLTGGFDSRIVFSLFLRSNIDLNKIFVYSKDTDRHKEDFEIASNIAKKYDFKLNNRPKQSFKSINNYEDSIALAYYTKLCYHKYYDFPLYVSEEPLYLFGGVGGESLRSYWNKSTEEFIESWKKRASKYSEELINPIKNVLEYNFKELQKEYDIEDKSSNLLPQILYKDVGSKYHFGKNSVQYYIRNQIRLSPLLDKNLFKLKKIPNNEDLLFILILTRYCPELLNFKLDNNKKFNKDLIEYAKKINKQFPFKQKDYDKLYNSTNKTNTKKHVITQNIHTNLYHEQIPNIKSPEDYIEKIFYSKSFRNLFESYFSHDLYEKVSFCVKNWDYQHLSMVNTTISILYIFEAVKFNKEKFSNTHLTWLNGFLKVKSFEDKIIEDDILNELIKYDVARIDIKNKGKNMNNLEIIDISDKFALKLIPKWFTDNEGIGHVIESHSNQLKLTLKCINTGTLNIQLRSKYVTDKNNNNFPIYIDYTKFKINNENILNQNKLTSIYEPYTYEIPVKNNDIIKIELEWQPFTQNSIYNPKINENLNEINGNKMDIIYQYFTFYDKTIDSFSTINKENYKEIKKLKINNKKLQDINNKNKEIKHKYNIDKLNNLFIEKNYYLKKQLQEYRKKESILIQENEVLKNENESLQIKLNKLLNSNSWKMTKYFRNLTSFFKK